ncbi:glycine-rich domain-containing protein [Streptomyces cyaneofuscatus]|uniref:glycine-rich domain-containing protein n=1 Tax=Streptomyces cyaneofuscatus TaxID=66883 RepID=UPI0036562FD7
MGVDQLPVIARGLIADERFTSCRTTVMDANPDMSQDMAGRIVEEGLKFVAACSRNPGVGLAPSRIVDEGWHALLHTAMYAELCEELGGSFVHHFPGYDPTNYDSDILERTRQAITGLGDVPDAELWGEPSDEALVSVAARCQHAPDCSIVTIPKPKPKG